jgi:hypothetical protein
MRYRRPSRLILMVRLSPTPAMRRVKDGSREHVGPVELGVALWIRQDLEGEGGRCFDPA